jgi:hypothetical protein
MVEMGGKRPFAKVLTSTTKSLPTVGDTAKLKLSAKEVMIKPFVPKLKSTVKALAFVWGWRTCRWGRDLQKGQCPPW